MAYNMQDLIKKWAGEEMTVEQMIGQLLLTVEAQGKQLDALSKQVYLLETALRRGANPERTPTHPTAVAA